MDGSRQEERSVRMGERSDRLSHLRRSSFVIIRNNVQYMRCIEAHLKEYVALFGGLLIFKARSPIDLQGFIFPLPTSATFRSSSAPSRVSASSPPPPNPGLHASRRAAPPWSSTSTST